MSLALSRVGPRALAARGPGAAPVRCGHHIRGVPPDRARSLRRRLAELNRLHPVDAFRQDVGFPRPRDSRSKEITERLAHLSSQRNNPDLERLSRNQELYVDLAQVEKDWLAKNGPFHIKTILNHYGVYKDLFDEGYFIPRVPLKITYNLSDDLCYPVYYGNVVKPTEAKKSPDVTYEADDDSVWTLMLTSLDSHLTESGKEYVHWCIANIPGNNIDRGDLLVDYLQPIPPKGTGFHRYVFVLYKQEQKVDYDIKKVTGCDCLDDRTFVTRDWYQKYQDIITPAGISFFQSNWDPNLSDFYHNHLKMNEPIYEYDFPKPYIKPQEWFPLREPFNLYMDKYRDPKQINKEYLLRKLKTEHPFKTPEPPLKFPNAHPLPHDMPSWLKLHEKKIRLGWGRVNDV